jgi:hypothetical protein
VSGIAGFPDLATTCGGSYRAAVVGVTRFNDFSAVMCRGDFGLLEA